MRAQQLVTSLWADSTIRRTSSSTSRWVDSEVSETPGRSGPMPSIGSTAIGPIARLMPQRPTMLARDPGQMLDVGLGAGGDVAEHELLGRRGRRARP